MLYIKNKYLSEIKIQHKINYETIWSIFFPTLGMLLRKGNENLETISNVINNHAKFTKN